MTRNSLPRAEMGAANTAVVGTDLKGETKKLMDQRSAIEAEINAVFQHLCGPAAPGLDGNLVDSEGFPRTDIDIAAVRAERHRLAELKNDHKDITEKISQNIVLLHAEKSRPKTLATDTSEKAKEIDAQVSVMSNGAAPTQTEQSRIENNPTPASIPFALIDEIAEASPAAEDGLQLGDQIVKFGSVESGENMLPMVAQEVQINQGNAISVTVMRHGALSSLSVTPRTWEGRGLLGCHFKPL